MTFSRFYQHGYSAPDTDYDFLYQHGCSVRDTDYDFLCQ